MPLKLLTHQHKPKQEMVDFLLGNNQPYTNNGQLCIGNTGCGKTYIIAQAIADAQAAGSYKLHESQTKLYSVLYITPKNSIEQQRRVLHRAGVVDFDVISSSALATSYGLMYISWVPREDKKHNIIEVPVWDKDMMPDLIIIDEVQNFKNPRSKRSDVLQAYINAGGKVIMLSATPFQKASESKLITTACCVTNNLDWKDYAKAAARPKQPTDNSPAAVKRIKEDLLFRNALIEIKGVRYPFKPLIRNRLIDLKPEKRILYNQAMDEYHEERRKMGLFDISKSAFYDWVAMNKFREKAEILRVEEICEAAYNAWQDSKVAVIIASNFVATLRKSWEVLVKQLGVPADKISHLVGGMSADKIQESIDNFQEGRTEFFLTTLKSGGTGLSLHDEHEYTKPRFVILPPTWSVYEMVQVLGRAQRITSRSQTVQEIVWFRDTVEERVADRLESKFDCLRELIDRKESFIHDIFNAGMNEIERKQLEEQLKKQLEDDALEDSGEGDKELNFDLGMLED